MMNGKFIGGRRPHNTLFLIIVLVLSSYITSGSNTVEPMDAVDVVLSAFDNHEIIALSEMHGLVEEHDFIQSLLRNKAFFDKVDVIVMEGGNYLYQETLDKYILRDEIPINDVRIVWRNSLESPNTIWDAEVYEQIYKTVHDINKSLPLADRVRIVGGGVSIDWDKVKSANDMNQYRVNRNMYYAQIVQKEVLEMNKKALLIVGGMHLIKCGTITGESKNITQILEDFRPGSVFVIWPHTGLLGIDTNPEQISDEKSNEQDSAAISTASLEKRLSSWPIPSVAFVTNTWLGDLPLSSFVPGAYNFAGEYIQPSKIVGMQTLSDGVDAYLYVGPIESLTFSPSSPAAVADKEYIKELNRRSLLRFGFPFDSGSFITKPIKYFSESP